MLWKNEQKKQFTEQVLTQEMVLRIAPKGENMSLNCRTILFFTYIFGKDPKVRKPYTIVDVFEIHIQNNTSLSEGERNIVR